MEDGRGSSGIGSGKSIGLAEGILLPTEPVESNRSRPKSVCVSEDRSPYCSAHDEWLIMKIGMHVGYHDANKVSNVYSDPVTELYGQYRLVLCCAVLRVRRTISVTRSLVVRLLLRDHAQAAGVWDNEVVNLLQCNQMAIPA